jgi:exopolysaccharide production protein ExoZ
LNYEAYFYVLFAALASLTAVSRVSILSCAFVGLWLIGLAFPISDPVAQFYLSISPLGFALGCWLGLKTINGARVDQLNVGVCGAAAIAGAILATTQAQLGVDAPLSIIGQLITAASLLLWD